jgi:hypothetical protein
MNDTRQKIKKLLFDEIRGILNEFENEPLEDERLVPFLNTQIKMIESLQVGNWRESSDEWENDETTSELEKISEELSEVESEIEPKVEDVSETIDEELPAEPEPQKETTELVINRGPIKFVKKEEALTAEEVQKKIDKEFLPQTPEVKLRKPEVAEKPSIHATVRQELLGATLVNDDGSEMTISENIFRKFGLSHGDEITYRTPDHHYVNDLKIVGHDDAKFENEYGEISMLVVEQDEETHEYYAAETAYDELVYEKLGMADFVVYEQAIEYFGLQVGDFIDVRYSKANPHNFKIIFKHDSDLPETKVAKTNYKKDKKRDEEAESGQYTFDLLGKTILVIGAQPYWGQWKDLIEENNGEFHGYDTKNGSALRFDTLVHKSDLVVFALKLASHESFYQGKDRAKANHIPFVVTNSLGKGALFRAIRKGFEKGGYFDLEKENQ